LAEWFLVGSADSKRLLVRMDRQVMPSIVKMARATGTIRPSTSPRMPTSGFEVRGRIVRLRSPQFANVAVKTERR
jgi:hypothetical protein